MTTVSTAEVRAWARQNGLAVADRGRVSSDVVNAWQSAQTPTRPKRRPAPESGATDRSGDAEASQSPSTDEELSASALMAEQLAALTERVQRLESRLAGRPGKDRKKQKK